MFRSFRTHERDALAPLIELARHKFGADRTLWLNELRADAPTVAARLEALLAEEAQPHVLPIERPRPSRERVVAPRGLDLSDPTPRSSVA
jgi:hypothetical protein